LLGESAILALDELAVLADLDGLILAASLPLHAVHTGSLVTHPVGVRAVRLVDILTILAHLDHVVVTLACAVLTTRCGYTASGVQIALLTSSAIFVPGTLVPASTAAGKKVEAEERQGK
jgi:hypothetical protein